MPPKPEPRTFDDLPKSSELENRFSEDGLRELAKTLNQYGVEDGLKRIEAQDPELAQRLRESQAQKDRRLIHESTATPSKIRERVEVKKGQYACDQFSKPSMPEGVPRGIAVELYCRVSCSAGGLTRTAEHSTVHWWE